MLITLEQILAAREERVARREALGRKWGRTVICFTMNIPGPRKDSPLIRRGFSQGCEALEGRIPQGKLLDRELRLKDTGCEAFYVADMPAQEVKALTANIEDTHGLGRLFDMDVFDQQLQKLDREAVGGGSRNCIVCGASGRGCASRRVHSVAQLQKATEKILLGYFSEQDARWVGNLAVESLLKEVNTTPKPGLVDARNSGSHRDMDIHTFYAGAAALGPYFTDCVRIGMETAEAASEETFALLRSKGLRAEQAMYAATGGVNTHKGAIFTVGLLCGAAGRLWRGVREWNADALCREVGCMTKGPLDRDWEGKLDTAGLRFYRQYGIRGIRGEASAGLPSVREIGLPAFRTYLFRGTDQNLAAVAALLHLIAQVEDTNMLSRGGPEGAKAGAEKAAALLAGDFTLQGVEALDDWFIERNLSPGGCADLLAAVLFLHRLEAGECIGS